MIVLGAFAFGLLFGVVMGWQAYSLWGEIRDNPEEGS